MPPRSPGRRLRDAYEARPIMIPGAFNALTARMAERLGFEAVYLSGGALAAGWAGVPDIGLLSAAEFAEAAAALARATDLPVLADADTGFGEAVNVERTVRLYEGAGAAGLHLEDQQMPKRCGHLSGKGLVDTAIDGRQDPRGGLGAGRPGFRRRREDRRPVGRGVRRGGGPGDELTSRPGPT